MPHVTVERGPRDNPVYQVGGKSFVFFRNPRPDAVDPETGERYDDVIVFWVRVRGRQAGAGAGRDVAVLHHAALQRPPVGAGAGQPDRRAHPPGAGRGDPGRLAVAGRRRAGRRPGSPPTRPPDPCPPIPPGPSTVGVGSPSSAKPSSTRPAQRGPGGGPGQVPYAIGDTRPSAGGEGAGDLVAGVPDLLVRQVGQQHAPHAEEGAAQLQLPVRPRVEPDVQVRAAVAPVVARAPGRSRRAPRPRPAPGRPSARARPPPPAAARRRTARAPAAAAAPPRGPGSACRG